MRQKFQNWRMRAINYAAGQNAELSDSGGVHVLLKIRIKGSVRRAGKKKKKGCSRVVCVFSCQAGRRSILAESNGKHAALFSLRFSVCLSVPSKNEPTQQQAIIKGPYLELFFATLQARKLNFSFNEGELSNIALAKEKQICLFALWQEGSGFCFEDITHTRAVWRERLRSNTLDRRTCE